MENRYVNVFHAVVRERISFAGAEKSVQNRGVRRNDRDSGLLKNLLTLCTTLEAHFAGYDYGEPYGKILTSEAPKRRAFQTGAPVLYWKQAS